MELTRNLTLGVYLPGKTALHCLDPRTKIAGASGLILLLILTNNYAAYASFAAFTLGLILMAKIPLGFALKGLRPMLPILAIMWVFQLLFQKPPGSKVIFSYWIFSATDAGAAYRHIDVHPRTAPLPGNDHTYIDHLHGGADRRCRSPAEAAAKIGVPAQELALTMVIALRFVPTLAEEAEKIIKAQTARGVDFRRGNFIRRTFKLFPVLLPLFINAFKRADELITAMESRCYTGGAGRTKMKVLQMGKSDYLAWGVFAAFTVVQVFLMLKIGRPY